MVGAPVDRDQDGVAPALLEVAGPHDDGVQGALGDGDELDARGEGRLLGDRRKDADRFGAAHHPEGPAALEGAGEVDPDLATDVRVVETAALGHRDGIAAGEGDHEDVLRGGVAAVREDPRDAGLFVDGEQAFVAQLRRGEGRLMVAVRTAALEDPMPVALGAPEEGLSAVEEARHRLFEVDPRLVALGVDRRRAAAPRVDVEEDLLVLESVLHEDREGAFARPVHRREVRVGVAIPIDPASPAAADRDHAQADLHVGLPGARIAVGLSRALGMHRVEDVPLSDGLAVRLLIEEPSAVGGPPVAAIAAHLLLGDELGHAVDDRVARRAGEPTLPSAVDADDVEVAIAHERHALAVR